EEGEVDLSEAIGLAKLMTDKNALWNTGMVGGKGVIAVPKGTLSLFEPEVGDSQTTIQQKRERKKLVIRLAFQEMFARGLIGPHIDVPAGDMRFGPTEVSHGLQGIRDIITANESKNWEALNLPAEDIQHINFENIEATLTGKPTDEAGLEGRDEATGFGVAQTTKALVSAFETVDPKQALAGKKIILQGYGNVGSWSAKHLQQLGAIIVGIAERPSVGNLYNEKGIDLAKLDEHYAQHKTFAGFEGYQDTYSDLNTFLAQHDCPDILVPAAKEGQINEQVAKTLINLLNDNSMKNFYLIEGANGPVTPKAESILNQRPSTIHIAPGPYANGGGVFVSCQERLKNLGEHDLNRETAFARLINQGQRICSDSTDIMKVNNLSLFRAMWSLMATL
ncbi:MAG: Glu/Leu/Phe/Val dehydrogenase dimerization domain-containing protein, partial [Gammaproteobacteria bacterium]